VERLSEMPVSTHFLNVDLDVYAPYPLGPLARAMEECGALTLHSGRWWRGGFRASFEVAAVTTGPNVTITALAHVVERLPVRARRLFDRATRRELSIGVEAGEGPHAYELLLSTASLAAARRLRARVSVTIYAGAQAGRAAVTSS
jgi:hypothetical protein